MNNAVSDMHLYGGGLADDFDPSHLFSSNPLYDEAGGPNRDQYIPIDEVAEWEGYNRYVMRQYEESRERDERLDHEDGLYFFGPAPVAIRRFSVDDFSHPKTGTVVARIKKYDKQKKRMTWGPTCVHVSIRNRQVKH